MMAKQGGAHERPSALFQQRPKLKPSVSFSGWSGLQSPTGHMGLYTATSQGTYSRYGVGVTSPVGPGRPLRSSLQHNTPPAQFQQQYTQNYQNFRTRRHTMGTIYATSPLRSPPVPSVGRRPSLERNSWPMSPTYEIGEMTLSPSVCASLVNYTEAFQDPKTGIQMQERRVVNQTQKVFTGSDAIQWLVGNVEGISSVEAAQLAGTYLLECGLILSVSQPGQKKFIGSPNALYQFAAPKQEQTGDKQASETNVTTTAPIETDAASSEGSKSKCLIQ